MPGSKKPRKKHKPKNVSTNVLADVFGGMLGTHGEHTTEVMVKTYASMRAMEAGTGTRFDFDRVVGALNMSNVMCEQGYGPEYRAELLAGRDAMVALGVRAAKSGQFMFEGGELEIVQESLLIHDAQLENARSIDIDRAFDEVNRRIKNRINTTSVVREMAKAA